MCNEYEPWTNYFHNQVNQNNNKKFLEYDEKKKSSVNCLEQKYGFDTIYIYITIGL